MKYCLGSAVCDGCICDGSGLWVLQLPLRSAAYSALPHDIQTGLMRDPPHGYGWIAIAWVLMHGHQVCCLLLFACAAFLFSQPCRNASEDTAKCQHAAMSTERSWCSGTRQTLPASIHGHMSRQLGDEMSVGSFLHALLRPSAFIRLFVVKAVHEGKHEWWL